MFNFIKSWWYKDNFRRDRLQNLALSNDLKYSYKDDFGLIEYLLDFELFKIGGSKKINHVIRNNKKEWEDPDIRVFDYKFTVGQGKSVRNFTQTVFFMQSKKLALPYLLMEPEQLIHAMRAYVGINDIDFNSFRKFSNQYWLQGRDRSLIRETMNDKVLHFFTDEKGWSLEGVNYYMILYKKNIQLRPDNIIDFYQKGIKVADMLIQEKESKKE